MIFNLFKNKNIKSFAKTLANDFSTRFPVELEVLEKTPNAEKKLKEAIKELYLRTEKYARENRIGWIKKIQLGNTLRWELLDIGYSDAFIKVLTQKITLHLANI